MIDPVTLLHKSCGSPHVSTQIDSLADLVKDAYYNLAVTVTTSTLALTTQVFFYLIQQAPEHPAVRNINDTLEQEIIALVLNRSTKTMTQLAKEHKISKQAISKRCMGVTDRLGMPVRSQKSDKARLAYDQRARKHHAKRRRETPPWNKGAFMKGLKCKH